MDNQRNLILAVVLSGLLFFGWEAFSSWYFPAPKQPVAAQALPTAGATESAEDKSLRQLQPMTGGQLTDAMLKQVAADLGAPDNSAPTTADGPVLPPATDAPPPASSGSVPEGR